MHAYTLLHTHFCHQCMHTLVLCIHMPTHVHESVLLLLLCVGVKLQKSGQLPVCMCVCRRVGVYMYVGMPRTLTLFCCVCVCVHILSYIVINLFLAITVICLNTFLDVLYWIIIHLIWILFIYMLHWCYVPKQISFYRTIKYCLILFCMCTYIHAHIHAYTQRDWLRICQQ